MGDKKKEYNRKAKYSEPTGLLIRQAAESTNFNLKSCAYKKKYNSEKGALMAIKFNPQKAGVRAYYCNRCYSWHTTKIPLYAFGEDQ